MGTAVASNVIPITRNHNLERLVSRLGSLVRSHGFGPRQRLTAEARKTLGESIQYRRERLCMSRAQLSANSGVSLATIYRMEQGSNESRNGGLLSVCRALGTSYTGLIAEAWGRV